MEYCVSIDIRGKSAVIGTITGEDSTTAQFAYAPDYLKDPDAHPVSISLPLQEERFSPTQTRNFFDGLLPEGFTRRSVAAYLQFDENDYLRILYELGQECLGALRISREGERTEARYEKLDPEQLRQLAAEGASESATLVAESRLSLAGASGKVGLYYDPESGDWYLPRGTAPSTHIIKQSHVRYEKIVPNEKLCLLTAAHCGVEAAESFVVNIGAGEDREILLASRRFDRVFPEEPEMIDGLPVPLRLHQEDFAQALGVSPSEKYEHGQHYMRDMFSLLQTRSANPIEDQTKLWDMILFDVLIGNTDAHLKNFCLLYTDDLRAVRLSPAYDIIHTGYRGLSRNMAFSIGGVSCIDEITRESFRNAAREVGLGERAAMNRLDLLISRFRPALFEASEELRRSGFSGADEIRDRILQHFESLPLGEEAEA